MLPTKVKFLHIIIILSLIVIPVCDAIGICKGERIPDGYKVVDEIYDRDCIEHRLRLIIRKIQSPPANNLTPKRSTDNNGSEKKSMNSSAAKGEIREGETEEISDQDRNKE